MIADPDAGRETIVKAVIEARGNKTHAARALDCTLRNLYRWIDKLDLWDRLDQEGEKRGFEVLPGAPRLKDRIIAALVESRGSIPRAARALDRTEDELLDRIHRLDLYEDINRTLKAAGLPTIPKRRAA